MAGAPEANGSLEESTHLTSLFITRSIIKTWFNVKPASKMIYRREEISLCDLFEPPESASNTDLICLESINRFIHYNMLW